MGVAASCSKQPGPRNRTENGCAEMLPDDSFHLNFVGRPKKPQSPISPYFKSQQDGARGKAEQGLHSFHAAGQEMPPKEAWHYR